MLCCMPSTLPENPSVQATKIFKIIQILSLFQLIFGLICLFVYLSAGFYMLFGSLILYMIVCGRNWCTSVCYILLILFDLTSSLSTLFQIFTYFAAFPHHYLPLVAIYILKVPFYSITMYYAFLAYKELRALTLEHYLNSDAQSWEAEPHQSLQILSRGGYSHTQP